MPRVKGARPGMPVETVARELERAIIMGGLHPRERLIELDLARRFGTPRNRIRLALRSLAEKGLVFLAPGRGAKVAEYGPKEIADIYHVRVILELAALELALASCGPGDIKALRALARRFSLAAKKVDLAELQSSNDEFHCRLLGIGHNPILPQLISQLWLRCHLVRHYSWLTPGRLKMSADEHDEIVDALERGDRKRLKKLYARHTLWGQDLYLRRGRGRTEARRASHHPASTRTRGPIAR